MLIKQKLNGEPFPDYQSKYVLSISGGSVPKDCPELVTVSIYDSQTYEAADFDNAEVSFVIDYTGSDKRRLVPVRVVSSSGSFDVTAGDPIYAEHIPTDEEMAAAAGQPAKPEPEAEEAEDPKEPMITEHAILNRTVGTSHNAADIIAIVRNPNEKTAIEKPSLTCVCYDADGKELGNANFAVLGSIRPGESIYNIK